MNTPPIPVETLPKHVAFIGLGLLGGSVAMAFRRANPLARLTAMARNPNTRRFAIEQSIVDEAFENPLDAARDADLVVVATPVDRISEYVTAIAAENSNAVFTDVGSTKTTIVSQVASSSTAAKRFLAAHPIAGSEKSGVTNATEDLLDNKVVVVTPSGNETIHTDKLVRNFWHACRATVMELSPQQHDDVLAETSHLPHLMASLLAEQTSVDKLPFAGSGWLGTTRVAAGDPMIWRSIVGENRQSILQSLRLTQTNLQTLIKRIDDGDDEALAAWLQAAKTRRDQADDRDADN